MEFDLLGPLEARLEGRPLSLGGPKQRAVLALLLLDRNRVVSRDHLIEGVWGERPPTSVQASLDSYVARLRSLLGGDRIERRTPGYLLRVEPGELDLDRFEELVARARAAEDAEDLVSARDLLDAALRLWRGRALADLESDHLLAESERLEDQRLAVYEARVDVELRLGGGAELAGELERLVRAHPYREALVGRLMLCLYRGGRQSEALAAYRACRQRFAEELGIEPGRELRALERRVLEHDRALGGDGAIRPKRRPPRRPHARLVVAGTALVLVAAAAVGAVELATGGAGAESRRFSAPGVYELDGRGSLVASAPLVDQPVAVVQDAGSLWLAEPDLGGVEQVDEQSGHVVDRVTVGGAPGALAVGDGAVWVTSVPGSRVDRIDPTTDAVTLSIPLGSARASAIAYGFGHLWVADATDDNLLEFDPQLRSLVQTFRLDLVPTDLATGAGAVWVADYSAGVVARIDPSTGGAIPIRVGNGPSAITVGSGAVWVANSLDSTVSRIDPVSDTVTATNSVGSGPIAIAADKASVEVANEYSSSISRLDARDGRLVGTSPAGGEPTALVSTGGRLWVGARPRSQHRGGTLVLLHTRPLDLDPGIQGDLPPMQSLGLVYDALLANPLTSGPLAFTVVPDLAVAVPVPTEGGKTFAFRLRPGRTYTYSDGRPVRASDFRRAIERLFRIGSAWSSDYRGIVGAAACTRTRCDLRRGIVTDDRAGTVVFHLTAPDRNFLTDLTYLASAPVPAGTPLRDAGDSIPGTGPYRFASSNNGRTIYVRNPRFHEWSHAAQPDGNPDEIVMHYGMGYAQEARAVERDQADWTSDPIPPALLAELKIRFASQLHYRLMTDTDFLELNTTIPPFDDVRVRQALNFAIDRGAIVQAYGGRSVATPTCQILPPGILGFHRYCPYTVDPRPDGRWQAPNLTRAKQLIRASGTRGDEITVWGVTEDPLPDVIRDVAAVLRRLGFRARARFVRTDFPDSLYSTMQIRYAGDADTTPGGFFGWWFLCNSTANHHWFCDPRLDAQIARAEAVEAADPRAADGLWARIDRALVDRPAWVPLVNPHWADLVSTHVHNYESFPNLGLIADQVTLR